MNSKNTKPVYMEILGDNYSDLPNAIQELHNLTDRLEYKGECNVKRGRNIASRVLATLMNFPPQNNETQIHLKFQRTGNKEYWERTFDTHRLTSIQWRSSNNLMEKIGFVTITFSISTTHENLTLKILKIHFFGIPVPAILHPDITAIETEQDNKFFFYVKAAMPFIGQVIEYSGWLEKHG